MPQFEGAESRSARPDPRSRSKSICDPGVSLLKRSVYLIGVLCLAFIAASPAQGARRRRSAGVKASARREGERMRPERVLVRRPPEQQQGARRGGHAAPVKAPSVLDGHVGGWVGVGGTRPARTAPPSGSRSASPRSATARTSQLYYEVTVAGAAPQYVELDPDVRPGDTHRVSVLEMGGAQVVVARLGRQQAGQPADPPSGQPRHLVPAGGRRELGRRHRRLQRLRLPLLGRHARAARTAGAGSRCRDSSRLRGQRLPGRCRPRRRRAASSRRACRPRARSSGSVSGVPTGISRASFRIDSFGMRMQPCETAPGQDLRLVRAVDADEAAARPVRQRRRARARPERDRPVDGIVEAGELVADVELAGAASASTSGRRR